MTDPLVHPLGVADHDALREFFRRVPEGDRTFFREDVLALGAIESWDAEARDARYVATTEANGVIGYLAIIPEVGWSSHVGELRVVVDPARRGQGIGRALARHGLLEALRLGLTKLIVEVVAEQDATLALFGALGFEPEALLRGHVRDGSGTLRDLIVMAHVVDETWDAMRTIGIEDALGP